MKKNEKEIMEKNNDSYSLGNEFAIALKDVRDTRLTVHLSSLTPRSTLTT